MPIPKPQSGEEKSKFMRRCIEAIASEYEPDQRIAICLRQWSEKNNQKDDD